MSSSGLGESRTELLSWLNDLLCLNYTRVEQCGNGAAYCQIMDSIFCDIPMNRVKFDSRAEYESLSNFKILQSCFTKHKIEKTIFVDRLIKCRFQDNLEFLQWLKKFWLQNKDESPYDAQLRRKAQKPSGTAEGVSSSITQASKKRTLTTSASSLNEMSASPSTKPRILQKVRPIGQFNGSAGISGTVMKRTPSSGTTSRKPQLTSMSASASNDQLAKLQMELDSSNMKIDKLNQEVTHYQDAMNIMERERDFYFGKLRDIEILVQSTQDLYKEGVYNDDPQELNRFLGKVNQILYSTEEGFEVTQTEEVAIAANGDHTGPMLHQGLETVTPIQNLLTDEETF
ncbi:HFR079Wp [Eremothecium sinecaudum]|uniref:HFR079Wp n=1 Tax=Eremothecium sinecaudum TaxID=45286 RepID=A0A0X8HUW7_9SACH|nr:HFR079Wp [Eremothecium sinecaudum]AMD21934.1 HFR079Wp [Eremothecium sinecaudum]